MSLPKKREKRAGVEGKGVAVIGREDTAAERKEGGGRRRGAGKKKGLLPLFRLNLESHRGKKQREREKKERIVSGKKSKAIRFRVLADCF